MSKKVTLSFLSSSDLCKMRVKHLIIILYHHYRDIFMWLKLINITTRILQSSYDFYCNLISFSLSAVLLWDLVPASSLLTILPDIFFVLYFMQWIVFDEITRISIFVACGIPFFISDMSARLSSSRNDS